MITFFRLFTFNLITTYKIVIIFKIFNFFLITFNFDKTLLIPICKKITFFWIFYWLTQKGWIIIFFRILLIKRIILWFRIDIITIWKLILIFFLKFFLIRNHLDFYWFFYSYFYIFLNKKMKCMLIFVKYKLYKGKFKL